MRTWCSSYVLYNLKNARLFIEGDECDTKGGIQRKESDFQYEKKQENILPDPEIVVLFKVKYILSYFFYFFCCWIILQTQFHALI